MRPDVERQLRDIHEAFSKADAALHAGKITQRERDAFLASRYGTASERDAVREARQPAIPDGLTPQSVTLVVGFAAIVLGLFATLFYGTGGITGAVVLEQAVGETYAADAQIALLLDGATRVNVTGTARGLGDVTLTLVMDGTEYEVYSYGNGALTTPHASMERSWYEEGETVEWNATNVSAAYLMTQAEAIALGDATSIPNLTAGEYSVKLIINDTSLTQEELAFTVAPEGAEPPSEEFSSCGEACRVNLTGNATLRIDITGEASVTLDSIIIAVGNDPPALLTPIPDVSGQNVTIDLSLYFADPDGDELLYDASSHAGLTTEVDGSTLTVAGVPGSYAFIAYASDLDDLASSNTFTVTIEGAAVNRTPEANETQEMTEPNATIETNLTEGTNAANAAGRNATAANETLTGLCDHPDPNQRPVDCLTAQAETYFEEDIYLENTERVRLGRVSAIGNLLIRGGVVENSIASPDAQDFVVGYTVNFESIPTVWIDSLTGDLHLRGTLHEENNNLVPPPGSYAVINRRGVYLAYIDREAGDMHVRGNVIPYRRVID